MTNPERKRLLKITRLACELAARLHDATCGEDDPHYDRSRTFSDRMDDHAFATKAARILNPTHRSLTKTK